MSATDTITLKINLVFNVNISSNIKCSKLVFDLMQKYKNYNKGSTLVD